jgi:hypothetical protein
MAWVRRLIVMALGAVLIAEAITAGRLPVVQFVIGLVMVGLVPIDVIVDYVTRAPHDEAEMERLREVMERRPDEGNLS